MKRGKPTRKKRPVKKPKHIIRKQIQKALQKVPKIKVVITKKTLGKTPEKYSFYLQDGRKIQTIYELIDELETMTQEQFEHYVTETQNHFANWIQNVFGERTLAEEIRHMHDRIEMQRAMLKHLVRELTKLAHDTRRKA